MTSCKPLNQGFVDIVSKGAFSIPCRSIRQDNAEWNIPSEKDSFPLAIVASVMKVRSCSFELQAGLSDDGESAAARK